MLPDHFAAVFEYFSSWNIHRLVELEQVLTFCNVHFAHCSKKLVRSRLTCTNVVSHYRKCTFCLRKSLDLHMRTISFDFVDGSTFSTEQSLMAFLTWKDSYMDWECIHEGCLLLGIQWVKQNWFICSLEILRPFTQCQISHASTQEMWKKSGSMKV